MNAMNNDGDGAYDNEERPWWIANNNAGSGPHAGSRRTPIVTSTFSHSSFYSGISAVFLNASLVLHLAAFSSGNWIENYAKTSESFTYGLWSACSRPLAVGNESETVWTCTSSNTWVSSRTAGIANDII